MEEFLVLAGQMGDQMEVGLLVVEEFIKADAGFKKCVGEDVGEGIGRGMAIGGGSEVKEQGFASRLFGASLFLLQDQIGGNTEEPRHRSAAGIKAFGAVERVFRDGIQEVLGFVADLRALCKISAIDVDAQGLEQFVQVFLHKARKEGSFFGSVGRRRRPRRRGRVFFESMAFQGVILVRCPHLAFALVVFCVGNRLARSA